MPSSPIDGNYRQLPNALYDPVSGNFVTAQAGPTTVAPDGTIYAANKASIASSATAPIVTNQVVGTPIYATAVLGAAAGGNASLAAVAGKITYINGFVVTIGHTTTATTPSGQVTVSFDGGTTTHMNFLIATSQSYPGQVQVTFPDPIPATLANTTIKVTAPTLAAAGIGSISVFGYQL